MSSHFIRMTLLSAGLLATGVVFSHAQTVTPQTVTPNATDEKAATTGGEKAKIEENYKLNKTTTSIQGDNTTATSGTPSTTAASGTPSATTPGAGTENDPNPATREHFSAPSGGMSSGAHIGNESPTKKGNSADGMKESEAAKQLDINKGDGNKAGTPSTGSQAVQNNAADKNAVGGEPKATKPLPEK